MLAAEGFTTVFVSLIIVLRLEHFLETTFLFTTDPTSWLKRKLFDLNSPKNSISFRAQKSRERV